MQALQDHAGPSGCSSATLSRFVLLWRYGCDVWTLSVSVQAGTWDFKHGGAGWKREQPDSPGEGKEGNEGSLAPILQKSSAYPGPPAEAAVLKSSTGECIASQAWLQLLFPEPDVTG